MSLGQRQAIIWTSAGIIQQNVSEMLIEIQMFSFKKIHLKISFMKWRSFCPGLNVLNLISPIMMYLDLYTIDLH